MTTTHSSRIAVILLACALAPACASPRPIEVHTDPPGAMVSWSGPGVATREVGRAPVRFAVEVEGDLLLRASAEGFDDEEASVPSDAREAFIDLVLRPVGPRRDEQAVLELLLARGPLSAQAVAEIITALPKERIDAALAALRTRDEVRTLEGDAVFYDLTVEGLGRLQAALPSGTVTERLLQSRRILFANGADPGR